MALCPPGEHCLMPRLALAKKWWKQKWPFYCKKCMAMIRFEPGVNGYYVQESPSFTSGFPKVSE